MAGNYKLGMSRVFPEDALGDDGDDDGEKLADLASEIPEWSLGIIHIDNPVRVAALDMINHKWFDTFIIAVIALNSICMAMADYRAGCLGRDKTSEDFGLPDRQRCGYNSLAELMNEYVFLYVFLAEMVVKVIALGFGWEGEGAYIRDPWNVIDFICVVAMLLDAFLVNINLKVLRMFRLLRPLNSVNKFPALKKLVGTFLLAIPRLGNVACLMSFVLLIFSIACMQFFKGFLHYRCRLTAYPTRVPSTWYRSCSPADYGGGTNNASGYTWGERSFYSDGRNCIRGIFFPTQEEFEAYRTIMVQWEVLEWSKWANYTATDEYAAAVATYGWGTTSTAHSDWACRNGEFQAENGFPHGIPVTDTHLQRDYPGYDATKGEPTDVDCLACTPGKRWRKRQRCIWLVDEEDLRPCSLPKNGGLHQCFRNTRQQRGRGKLSDAYSNPRDPTAELVLPNGGDAASSNSTTTALDDRLRLPMDPTLGKTTCGSNYDEEGYPRFKYVPPLYTKQILKHHVPKKLDDWSRYPTGFYRSMYPEFIAELNFGYTNFDSLVFAFVALFQAVTMEGWTDIMYHCMDVYNPIVPLAWFLLLFGIGSMLVLNLVLGVIADTLSDEEEAEELEDEEAAELDAAEAEAAGAMVLTAAPGVGGTAHHDQCPAVVGPGAGLDPPLGAANPPAGASSSACATATSRADRKRAKRASRVDLVDYSLEDPSGDYPPWRRRVYQWVQSNTFSYFIYGCIFLNTFALIFDDYPAQMRWTFAMTMINFALSIVFIVEMVFKLVAFGYDTYVSDSFNCFDGFIVWVGIFSMIFAISGANFGGGAVSALRCARVFRIFKLAKNWKSLQVLLKTMVETAEQIAPFLVLLILFMFIFTLAGMQFFANELRFDEETGAKIRFSVRPRDHPEGTPAIHAGQRKYSMNVMSKLGRSQRKVSNAFKNAAPPDLNFDDFGVAFVTVFGILTGESWNLVMYDLIRGKVSGAWGIVYMFATQLFLTFFVMNMFLAILLSGFEGNDELAAAPSDQSNVGKIAILRRESARVSGHIHSGSHNIQLFAKLPHREMRSPSGSGVQQRRSMTKSTNSGTMDDSSHHHHKAADGDTTRQTVEFATTKTTTTTTTTTTNPVFSVHTPAASTGTPPTPKGGLILPKSAKVIPATDEPRGAAGVVVVGGVTAAASSSVDGAAGSPSSTEGGRHLEQDVDDGGGVVVPVDGDQEEDEAPAVDPYLNSFLILDFQSKYDRSLGLFPFNSPVRRFSRAVTTDWRFDALIVTCILIGSVMLAGTTILENPKSRKNLVFDGFSRVFNIVFYLEFALKVLSKGWFWNGQGSYIRDPWNMLDFIIVCVATVDFADVQRVRAIKVLRMLRVFRPLRMLSRNPGLKLVLNCLIVAIPNAMNVMLVCVIILLIFAIMGVGFFKGQMHECNFETSYPPGWRTVTDVERSEIEQLITYPIHLKRAIRSGHYDMLYNISGSNPRCWVDFDESFINAKTYFNPKTNVASDLAWELEGMLPSVISSTYAGTDGLGSKMKNGVAPSTVRFFGDRYANNVSAVTADLGPSAKHLLQRGGNVDKYIPTSKDMCQCIFWDSRNEAWYQELYMSFDNVATAFWLLFEIYSTEGWLDYMFKNTDARGIEMQLMRDQKYRSPRTVPRVYSFGYHILFQFIGGFFAMQLFVGVIIEQFSKLKDEAEKSGRSSALMTEAQELWARTEKFLVKIKPKRKIRPRIVAFYEVVEGSGKDRFEHAIMGCIMLNGFVMCLDHFGQPQGLSDAVMILNYSFAIIFQVECILKVGGIGWSHYIQDSWNKFDFVIVALTDIGIALSATSEQDIGAAASVIRLVRVARIFRLLNSAKNLKKQVSALLSSIPQMFNVFLVLMIFLSIFAILLMQLYAHVEYVGAIHPTANFQDFGTAVMTLLRFTTGENWNGFMHDLNFKWKSSGCWKLFSRFDKVRADMYRNGRAEDPWPDKWCTRLDGGDKPVCPCKKFERKGVVKDICQKYVTYEDCCVPLSGCGDKWVAGFVIHFFDLLVSGVVLNLFVGIILDAYGNEEDEEDDGLNGRHMDAFVEDWSRFDENATWFIPISQLKEFVQILDEPMGFGEQYVASNEELEYKILKLGFRVNLKNVDENDVGHTKLHIRDVAIALGRRVVEERERTDDILATAPPPPGGGRSKRSSTLQTDATPYLEKYFGRTLDEIERSLNDGDLAAASAKCAQATTTQHAPSSPPLAKADSNKRTTARNSSRGKHHSHKSTSRGSPSLSQRSSPPAPNRSSASMAYRSNQPRPAPTTTTTTTQPQQVAPAETPQDISPCAATEAKTSEADSEPVALHRYHTSDSSDSLRVRSVESPRSD